MDEQMIAKIVHDAMVWAAKIRGEPRKWCNGNSFAEDRAREAASEIASVIAGKVAELEGLLWRAMDDASMEPGDWYAEARALLDTTLPTAEDIRGILRDDAALAPYPERRSE